jgi:glycosyltransferase involved in cell wall biosynthesis
MLQTDVNTNGEIAESHMMGKIAVIMPAHNEADTIERTVRELFSKALSRMGNADVCVFEDGSTDGTKEILNKLSAEFPFLQIRSADGKKGYPRAMRDAFLSIDENVYEYVVAMDSDGQYDPIDLLKMWKIMRDSSPDIVMGRRITRWEPPYRKLLSKGLQTLERIMFPTQCKDVTSVMRLMRVKIAHQVAKEVCYSKYNFWLEFTARMSLRNYSVIEVPISYRQRNGDSKVYGFGKMPNVIFSEFAALWAVKKEYKKKLPPSAS